MPVFIGSESGLTHDVLSQPLPAELAEMHSRVQKREMNERYSLPLLSERLGAAALYAARQEVEQGRSTTQQNQPPVPEWRTVLYSEEVVAYLGLDRLKHPKCALHRLMRLGVLPYRKIGGRLTFARADIDRIIAQGRTIRTGKRGRPKGSRNKPRYTLPPV